MVKGEAFIQECVQSTSEVFGDSLRSIILFGSYARGEAIPQSDVDMYCIFDHLEQSLDFYPICLTTDEFSGRGFDRTFADPIKYFEGKVLFGELILRKPIQMKIITLFSYCTDHRNKRMSIVKVQFFLLSYKKGFSSWYTFVSFPIG